MKKIVGTLSLILILVSELLAVDSSEIRKAVVKIYTTYSKPNYYTPWQMKPQSTIVGSGVIIIGKRILTNAHIVSDSTFIQVKLAGRVKKYVAQVEHIAHDSDLALLKVQDEEFFQDTAYLDFGDLPMLQDKVAVYGFPRGGEEMCITEGVISRIEHRRYVHSRAYLLTCQMDAAINPGSSGGPVIKDGKIVGISFQSGSGENISYMVPTILIKRFLEDIKDKKYDGVPDLCISWQELENPDLRESYGLDKNQTGILVTEVYPVSKLSEILFPHDVILSIDGVNIDNDGTIEFRNGERTSFLYLVQNKQLGDKIIFRILRNRKIVDVSYILDTPVNVWRLVPNPQYDVLPKYFIFGGLVFSVLTYNIIDESELDYSPSIYTYYYYHGRPSVDRKEVVILLRTLADEINIGYQDLEHLVIAKVNDKKISSLKDLVNICETTKDKYVIFTTEDGRRIVLDRNKCFAAKDRILKKYKIPSDRYLD